MTGSSPKVCIIGASFNTDNLGVSVLAAGAIRCVLHSFPSASISQLDYAREGNTFDFLYDGRPISIRLVNIRFSKKFYLANNIALLIVLALMARVLCCGAITTWLLSRNSTLREISGADFAFSLAGGDSFSDIYGLRRLIYTSLPQILMLVMRKRMILLPQTVGPFRRSISRVIGRYILNGADTVYCRDRLSLNLSRQLLRTPAQDPKIQFCYDLGFDVEARGPSNLIVEGLPDDWSRDPALVGFNVSGLLMIGGYTKSNMFGLNISYAELVRCLIEFLITKKSATVLLVPHVFGSASENDVQACEEIYGILNAQHPGRIGLLEGSSDYGAVKYVIGQVQLFVGARMHACIGALSQSVPAVSVAYSDKFAGVMEAVGVAHLVVDPRRMELKHIVSVVDHAFDKRAELRSSLQRQMPDVRRTIEGLLRDLPRDLNSALADEASI